MCLIIDQPRGHILTPYDVREIYRRNKDGFGVMWAEGGKVHTRRYLPRNEEQAVALYQRHAGRECVLHWRMATHGKVTLENVHPFMVSDDIAMVHNGVLWGYGSKDESDTREFVRTELAPLLAGNETWLQEPDLIEWIESAIVGSAMVFVRSDGRVERMGNAGLEHNGAWYSNTYAWDCPKHLLPKIPAPTSWWDEYGSGPNDDVGSDADHADMVDVLSRVEIDRDDALAWWHDAKRDQDLLDRHRADDLDTESDRLYRQWAIRWGKE